MESENPDPIAELQTRIEGCVRQIINALETGNSRTTNTEYYYDEPFEGEGMLHNDTTINDFQSMEQQCTELLDLLEEVSNRNDLTEKMEEI